MIILPPGTMSAKDIELLRDNGICVVEAKNPIKVKFVDPVPIPPEGSRTQMEQAAIKLSRILLKGHWGNYTTAGVLGRNDITKMYVEMLIQGTSLDPDYRTKEEMESQIYDAAKADELRRLAREEAKAERAAAKAAAQTKPK